ncbi:MAG TPA: glycosyltransferase family 39 protein [Candidatus Goldiibacteriota bacterium]|nr:glycosyltransferase family 39 protein [Candidatus Goldiibacteriota bacterium]HRQ44148.1 glycosyltransferase family 39 protein [Candidatus Goldiibacteriota bacterium]
MNKMVLWVLGGIILILTQVFIMMNQVQHAVIVLIAGAAVFVGVLLFAFRNKIKIKHIMPEILVGASLITAVLATFLLKTSPRMTIAFYVISGIMLFFSRAFAGNFMQQGELKTTYDKMEKWEPYFVAFLLLFTMAIRFALLNDIPAGIQGHEKVQMGDIGGMAAHRNHYVWHLGASAEWPSMSVYQGIFFADIFGWNIGSFRMQGAFWGTVTVMFFYFLARNLFSASAAAFAAVLFSTCAAQISFSRNLSPSPILYGSMLIASWLFIAALRNKKWYFFGLSGLMLGFTLHGYIAGRIMPAAFAALALFILIFRRKAGLTLKHLGYTAAGFLISAGPIGYFAWKEPDLYWAYLQSVNPNQTGGPFKYIQTFINNIPMYLNAFHIKGDCNPAFQAAGKPMLEPVAQTLFPIGLVAAILMLFTPVGVYLAAFFFVALLPSMLGSGGSGHPSLSRMLGVFPPIFLMIALVFDRILTVVKKYNSKKLNVIAVAVISVFVAWGSYNGLYEYFGEMTTNLSFKSRLDYDKYIAAKMTAKAKDTNIYMAERYANYSFPPKTAQSTDVSIVQWPEEFLILNPDKRSLLMLDTCYLGTEKFFSGNFKNAKIGIINEKDSEDKTCISFGFDRHAPETVIYTVDISADDIKELQKLIDAKSGQKVDVYSQEFMRENAGKPFQFKGAVIVKENETGVKIKINWPGWTVSAGKEAFVKEYAIKNPGIHYFTVKGIIPSERMPRKIFDVVVGNTAAENRVVGLTGNYGLKAEFYKEEKEIGKVKPLFTRNILFPAYRIYDGYAAKIPVPFYVNLSGYFINPEDKELSFFMQLPSRAKIFVDGKRVFNNFMNEPEERGNYVNPPAGRPVPFNAVCKADGGLYDRTFVIKANRRGDIKSYDISYDSMIISK